MLQIKALHSFFLCFFSFAFSFICFLTPLHSADQEQRYKDVVFVCTGVGESKEDPRWKEYPLKLMFAASGRAYISEVQVEIQDASGKLVLKTLCDGPWLLAKLKPGKYSAKVSVEGAGTKVESVTVPESGQNERVFRFANIPQGE